MTTPFSFLRVVSGLINWRRTSLSGSLRLGALAILPHARSAVVSPGSEATFASWWIITTLKNAILWVPLFLSVSLSYAQLPTPISLPCEELPFDSFPPNQLLRSENGEGSAIRVLSSGKIGTWGEFFIEVDQVGTYRVDLDLLRGPEKAIFQLIVDGEPVGDPADCYSVDRETPGTLSSGEITFLTAGTHSFRFLVTGKNPSSQGQTLSLQKITLTPVQGFTLASPNGSCQEEAKVLLRWNSWSAAKQYRVEIDGQVTATLEATELSYQTAPLISGSHRWRVVAIEAEGKEKPSNTFSFVVGPPPPYPFREFKETFSATEQNRWTMDSMKVSQEGTMGSLQATGTASAIRPDVCLDKTEGEISTQITPSTEETTVGVGFQSDDGTRLYAVVDLKRQQLRLERSLQGTNRYSIFEVTPKEYQVPGWSERNQGENTIWEIAAKKIQFHPGVPSQLKLSYSRRSGCVMASLIPSDGSSPITLRDLTDLRTPDHPLLVELAGAATFSDVSLRLLNQRVYKWDPDTTRIVLRPGKPGSWDEKGAFNPAIVVRNGLWYLVYRGNAKPAPPNGPISSDLGLATSTDGIHWIKSSANPIIRREANRDSDEDPDLIWPKGSDLVYLEYHSHHVTIGHPDLVEGDDQEKKMPHGEVMRSSSDFIHWSEPWILNIGKTFGKNGGFLDTQEAGLPGIRNDGTAYRYISMIEEGRIDLSNDLHQWIKAGTADLTGSPHQWCSSHECSGDIFVDADQNIRFESQIGLLPESGHGNVVVGNRLCTIGEGVLSGSDPTKVLWRSDLPWLTDWYGDAPTGAPEDFTALNGSVFPGQTIIKDGWLWHYSGGNNHFTVLTKCWYGPLFACRDLQAKTDATGQCTVSAIVRNIGSLNGSGNVTLTLDGKALQPEPVTLDRDTEKACQRVIPLALGPHTLTIDQLSITLMH